MTRPDGMTPMDASYFKSIRNKLGKTQVELAHLLGTSAKAVQSYEQGWRNIPFHIERHLLYLLVLSNRRDHGTVPCWELTGCKENVRDACPAWEFRAGEMCWFITGTKCNGITYPSWREKMDECRRCVVLQRAMGSDADLGRA